MKKAILSLFAAVLAFSSCRESDKALPDRVFDVALRQYAALDAALG